MCLRRQRRSHLIQQRQPEYFPYGARFPPRMRSDVPGRPFSGQFFRPIKVFGYVTYVENSACPIALSASSLTAVTKDCIGVAYNVVEIPDYTAVKSCIAIFVITHVGLWKSSFDPTHALVFTFVGRANLGAHGKCSFAMCWITASFSVSHVLQLVPAGSTPHTDRPYSGGGDGAGSCPWNKAQLPTVETHLRPPPGPGLWYAPKRLPRTRLEHSDLSISKTSH